jgi:protoporphyrinogen oxidase
MDVTVLEASETPGGLASSFDLSGVRLERYYHFICKGDDDLVDTVRMLGLESRLRWRRSRMAYFVDGTLYPFLTPLDLLRFRPLAVTDRIRAGLALQRARRMREKDLAPRRAVTWLREMFGDTAFNVIWNPLMQLKFAAYAPDVSAAWIWARMVRLSRSRPSAWHEELGYLEGGSPVVLNALASRVEALGGRVLLRAPAEALLIDNGRAVGVRAAGQYLPADAVVSTVNTAVFLRLMPRIEMPYFSRLERIPTIGIFCVLFRLSRALTPIFWVNASDRRVPFAGMIEYTNLNPMPELSGDHILYVPQYLPVDDPRFLEGDECILKRYMDALALVNPAFEPSWVRFAAVFRDRYAQPVCLTDYRTTTPTVATPIANLFLTNACQLHPHDRTISGAFGLGKTAARLARASGTGEADR